MMGVEYAFSCPEGQVRKIREPRVSSCLGRAALGPGPLIWAMALLTGCSFGETPPPPPSEALVEFLGASEVEMVPAGPGLVYYGLRNLSEPWAAHLLRVELGRCEIGLEVLEAPVSNGRDDGRSRVSELVAQAGEGMIAGVNGDFFTPEGSPVGTEVVDGSARRIRGRPALAWHPDAAPWMGVPGTEGDSILVLGWKVPRSSGDGETQAIGGFPLLLVDGKRVGDLEVGDRASFAAERHPRTAVGFDPQEEILWIVVVDGRQPAYSMGMTLPELATLFEILGVKDAINLDGGGSSVMVLEGEAVSHPSDADGERPVVNALGVRWDSALCNIRG